MNNTKWRVVLATLAVGSTAFAAQPKLYCTVAKKEVKTCCCEMKEGGKSFCKLTRKTFDKCCCVKK